MSAEPPASRCEMPRPRLEWPLGESASGLVLQSQAQVCAMVRAAPQAAGSFCAGLNLAIGQARTALPGVNCLA